MGAREEAFLLLNDNEAQICAAVACAVDERGWLPDQVVVLVLCPQEELGAALIERYAIPLGPAGLAVGWISLAAAFELVEGLGTPSAALAPSPAHGRVRALCTVCSTIVVAHSLYLFPHNRDQWQRRLDRLIDRAMVRLVGPGSVRGGVC